MKAIVVSEFGDENVLQLKDIDTPEPAENEVRIRMEAVGVNPVETYIRSGKYGTLPSLPYTPGNDGAGVVDKVGPNVQRPAVGDRVFVAATLAHRNTGTYAEYVVCDADAVQILPERVTFSQGAGLGTPGMAATDALFSRARLRPGETVLVQGASGGVGSLAVQLARKAGAIVFGTAGSADGEKLVTDLGAHRAFNYHDDDYLKQIVEASGGCGPDVIIEMVANVNLANDLSIVAKYGRIVVVGSRGSLDLDPRLAMSKDAAIMGMNVANMRRRNFVRNMFRLTAAMESGLDVVVSKELPLGEAPQAHQLVTGGREPGKVILTNQAS